MRQKQHEPPEEAVRIFGEQLLAAFGSVKGNRTNNQLATRTGIDRRKITQLSKGKLPRSLNYTELLALNSLTNGALAGALQKQRKTSIIHSLEGAKEVTFILGAREVDKTDHVSRWDVRAMAAVVRAIQTQCAKPPQINVEDVLRARPSRTGSAFDLTAYLEKAKNQRWPTLLDRYEGALIAVGSTRSCHVIEHMLASMFECEIYNPRAARPPFHFVWTEALHERLPSSFARPGSPPARSGGVASEILGLDVGETFYPITPQEPSWDAYGVCVAQRRRTGATWCVIAGATGPASLATADQLSSIDVLLPEPQSPDVDGAPVWFVVKAEVQQDEDRVGDNRFIGAGQIVRHPAIWHHEEKRSATLPPEPGTMTRTGRASTSPPARGPKARNGPARSK